MSITPVTLQRPGQSGAALTTTTGTGSGAGNGIAFSNPGGVVLYLENTSGANTPTVTIVTGKTVSGSAVADVDVALATSQTKIVTSLDPDKFNQPSGANQGQIILQFDANFADVEVAAIAQ